MNFAVYIDKIGNHEVSEPILKDINTIVYNPMYKDVSLFYNDVGPMPTELNCGAFNSTDLQFFEGDLLIPFIEGVKLASNVVSNCNLYFLYDLQDGASIFDLLSIKNVTILAKDDATKEFLFRKLPESNFPICRGTLEAYNYILELKNET